MMDAIVVAGGDSVRRFQLTSSLGSDHYKITVCQSLADFRTAAGEGNISAILLLYPDDSGVIGEFFESEIITEIIGGVPLILISSSPAENNQVRSLHYEADEFLIEPISLIEVVNLINDSSDSNAKNDNCDILAIGDLVLDRASLTATLRRMKLPLYPIQVRILELLMLSPGRVFTRHEILNDIWTADRSIDNRTVDVSIGRIRDALRHKVSVDPIRTVRGVGYAFNEHFGQITSFPKKGHPMKRAR